MLDALRLLIGAPPAGYEWVEYIILAVVLLLVIKISVDVFFSIFRAVMKW